MKEKVQSWRTKPLLKHIVKHEKRMNQSTEDQELEICHAKKAAELESGRVNQTRCCWGHLDFVVLPPAAVHLPLVDHVAQVCHRHHDLFHRDRHHVLPILPGSFRV